MNAQLQSITRDDILNALEAWVNQRPGLEPANYFCGSDYRANLRNWNSERRSIYTDLKHARVLLSAVRWRANIGVPELREAFRAYSGRLTLVERNGRASLEYCIGQYWPTEYRRAACAVLAAALWEYERNNLSRKPGFVFTTDFVERIFRKEFGRHIAARWFS